MKFPDIQYKRLSPATKRSNGRTNYYPACGYTYLVWDHGDESNSSLNVLGVKLE